MGNLLHARLKPIKEGSGLPHESQCGFRPERGTTDASFSLKQALRKRREHGLETWVVFIDLVKAFDRVPREMLWEVLLRYGVPPKLVSLLRALHAHLARLQPAHVLREHGDKRLEALAA